MWDFHWRAILRPLAGVNLNGFACALNKMEQGIELLASAEKVQLRPQISSSAVHASVLFLAHYPLKFRPSAGVK